MKVGNDIFDILNGLGFRIKMFNEEGKISTDAEESTRFYSESPNIMISIEPEDNIIKLARGSAHTVEEMEPIRKRIKELAGDSLMKFEYKIFNKNITPKDQAYQIKRETMENINEFRKLAGLPEMEENAGEYSYTLEYNGESNGYSIHKLTITSPEGETKEIADDFTYFDVEGDELQAELESWFHKGMGVADASANESIEEAKCSCCGNEITDEGCGCDADCPHCGGVGKVDEGSKPDFLDLDGDGDKEETMKKAVKDKKKKDEGRIEDTFGTDTIDKHDKPKKKKKVEEGFGKLVGSRKTSYQPLDQDVKIVVRHKKEVDEDVKGSRSRNISKIFIERAGERFKFPVNSMIGARAMARHMSNGGEVHDTIGEQIVEMTGNLSTVRQFLNAVKSKNLMNEENEEYVKLAVENLSNSRDILKSLAGAKTYTRAISELAVFSQNEIIEEDNEDLMNYFKETFVDSRIESVLGTLNKYNKQKQNFESKVNEELETTAISKSFFRTLNPESNLTEWLTEMTSMVQGDSLKYLLLNSVRKIKNNVSLSEFETNTIKKIMSGQGSQINESINESKEFTDFIEELTKDI